MVRWLVVAVGLCSAGLPGFPRAAEAGEGGGGTLSLLVDNDWFHDKRKDGQYSSGVQLNWQSAGGDVPRWLDPVARRLARFDEGDTTPGWGLALGQNIYTPDNTFWVPPDPRDRPYAGWLYGAVNVALRSAERVTSVELQVGVVGPWALGREAQNVWHDLVGERRARGWAYQLRDEPGVNVVVTRLARFRWLTPGDRHSRLAADAIPSVTVSAGNVQTFLGTGLLLRVGTNLAADFGPAMIRPSASGAGSRTGGGGRGWYVFAGVEGRAVARDIFLDGNTFRSGPGVERKPFVGDLRVGFSLVFRRFGLTYSHGVRTREHAGQADSFQFGSVIVSVRTGGRSAL